MPVGIIPKQFSGRFLIAERVWIWPPEEPANDILLLRRGSRLVRVLIADLGSDSLAQLNTLVSERAVEDAKRMPPPTRARLRGEFIEAAKNPPRNYTVDWVHLKLNDRSPGTIVLNDPFESKNERVAKMIASFRSASSD